MIQQLNQKTQILPILHKINQHLLDQWETVPGIGVHAGKPGIALYFAYYARFSGEEAYLEHSMEILSHCVESLNEEMSHYSLCSGLAGLAWTITHLSKEGFFDVDLEGILSEIDEYLKERVLEDISHKQYDFLHGGLGLAIYFLERYPDPIALEILPAIIDALDEVRVDDQGIKIWEDHFSRDRGDQSFNLGLAHGIPSIVVFLSRLKHKQLQHEKLDELLEDSVTWMLRERFTEAHTSCFPMRKVDSQPDTYESRLGWCYGDMGVANAIWLAGEATENEAWKQEATKIFAHAANREQQTASVVDGTFCHGSVGISHIFQHYYRRTNTKICKTAADFWMEDLLTNPRYRDQNGFWQHYSGLEQAYKPSYILLEGAPGVGLALLASLDPTATAWDRVFLLS